MSYCRFAWDGSDVYVFEAEEGIVCCGCRLYDHYVAEFPEDMINHLAEHRRADHFVPKYAVDALWDEIPGADKPVRPEPESLTKLKRAL